MNRRAKQAPVAVAWMLAVALGGGCRSTPVDPPAVTPAAAHADATAARASVTEVARTCARITSCGRMHDPTRLRDPSACVDWWLQFVAVAGERPLHDCVHNARSCADVDACTKPPGDERARAACRTAGRGGHIGRENGSFCDGKLLVTCNDDDPAQSSVVDCATMNATCGESRGAGGLVTRACLAPSVCPPDAPEARCDGTRAILTCNDGAVARVACPAGFRCDDMRDEGRASASCAPPEDVRCATAGGRTCEDDTLVDCVAHGHFRAVGITDCRARGLVCAGTGEGSRCAVSRDAACNGRAPRCEGNTLVFCAAGMEARMPCTEAGFAGCDADAHGSDAACAPSPTAPAGNDAGVSRP